MWSQRFIQSVLLMSIFERRLSFRMLYFMKNVHKIILKCRWVSGDAVNSAAGLCQSPGEDSRGKPPGKLWPLYIWCTINSLKYSRNKAN